MVFWSSCHANKVNGSKDAPPHYEYHNSFPYQCSKCSVQKFSEIIGLSLSKKKKKKILHLEIFRTDSSSSKCTSESNHDTTPIVGILPQLQRYLSYVESICTGDLYFHFKCFTVYHNTPWNNFFNHKGGGGI